MAAWGQHCHYLPIVGLQGHVIGHWGLPESGLDKPGSRGMPDNLVLKKVYYGHVYLYRNE